MKIQKIGLIICMLTSANVFAAPPAMNAAPATNPVATQGASTSPASILGQPGAHEEGLLDTASEEKRKEEFLSEVVQDEQKIAQMAKEFDVRLKKIEDAFSGMCNNATHSETGGNLNTPTGPSFKPGGGITGTPMSAEHMTPPASPTTLPSAGANTGTFNTPPAPQK
jgi:hypothetical protein